MLTDATLNHHESPEQLTVISLFWQILVKTPLIISKSKRYSSNFF